MADTPKFSDQDLAMLFRQASRLMARVHHRRDHAHHAQHHVLALILERGAIPQGELLEILDVRSSSLSEVLSKLERNGLVTRERNEKDRRSFIVSATDKARDLAELHEDASDADTLFAALDQQERESLHAILTKIVASLQQEPLCAEPGCGRGRHGRNGHGFGNGEGRGMGRGMGRGKGFGRGRGNR